MSDINKLLEELNNKIEQIQEENLALETALNALKREKENKKWQPEMDEQYYLITSAGAIDTEMWYGTVEDNFRLSVGNCFQTEAQAEQYRENLKTKAELEALADELNGEEVIDWSNLNQDKYYLIYAVYNNRIGYSTSELCMISGNVYCLDENFKTKAIERIGKQRLIDMIRSGV
jgi:hypothetical protein